MIDTLISLQGVVSGVLLVTPNAVMFDPNVSDTLVMEHGPESYGVIAPMEYVVNAAIFYDIAHMRTHGPDHNTHKYGTLMIKNISSKCFYANLIVTFSLTLKMFINP